MAWKAKENVLWFKRGEIVEEIQENWKPHFEEIKSSPKSGSKKASKKDDELDLNGDGKFDKKDKSIAAKVLATKRKKK